LSHDLAPLFDGMIVMQVKTVVRRGPEGKRRRFPGAVFIRIGNRTTRRASQRRPEQPG
jgi:hypothetical protein